MKLLIEVELGNEAMQSVGDATGAITTAMGAQASSMLSPLNEDEVGTIRDRNGNTVGKWEVVS